MHTANRQLEVIAGCMFSGKTTELLRRLEIAQVADQLVLLLKATIDDRYDQNTVVTHGEQEFDGEVYRLGPGNESMEALQELVGEDVLNKADVIAFDEGNFFSDKLVGLCDELVAMGKRVIVAGLDLQFNEEPFGSMPALLAKADRVDKLQAVCKVCKGIATRTQRFIDGEPAPADDPAIVVGGKEAYEARCRECHDVPRGL